MDCDNIVTTWGDTMERKDGYLVIDNYKKILADKDKEQYWIYIDGEEYYFKPASSEEYAYNELIAYHAAQILGIECCYYDLASLCGKKGVISKSLRKEDIKLVPGEIILGDYLVSSTQSGTETKTAIDVMLDLGLDKQTANSLKKYCFSSKTKYGGADDINTLEILYIALKERYGNKINIDEVMNQIIKMFIFDILFNGEDRHSGNYIFIESKTNIKLAALFDNAYIFRTPFGAMSLSVGFRDQNASCNKSLMTFFETYPSTGFEMFLKMFDTLLTNFSEVITATENQLGEELPKDYKYGLLGKFSRHIDILKKVIKAYTLTSTKIIGVSMKKYKVKTTGPIQRTPFKIG